jgi:hypothetical protein
VARGPGTRSPRPWIFGVWPVALCLLTAGCGYIGDPLPPLANIPAAVTDLAAVQRGARIILHFTPPELTTEGRDVKQPLAFDLRVGTAVVPFTAEAWALHATHLPAPPVKNGLAEIEIPSQAWTGQDVTLGVRSIGPNHKPSGWSNFVDLTVVAPPQRPTDLKPEATANGVRLTWQGDGGDFLVLRRAGDETDFSQVGEVHEPQYLDRTAEFGKPYHYLVQRIVMLPNNRFAQSELSPEVSITPIDIFPPGAPTGLHAVPAPGSIELAWDQNPESDVAGYHIYRAAPGGAFVRLTETGPVPAYSDHLVESGKTYRYTVAAVDRAGNESARSPEAEATAQ